MQSVTWKWLVGILTTVLVLGAGAWATTMQAQVNDIKQEQRQATKDTGMQAADIAVIKEKLRTIEDRQKEQSEKTNETNRKLDELLNRSRPR